MLSFSKLQDISRLGIFIVDAKTGRPLPRVPIYAEIALDGGFVIPRTKGSIEIEEAAPQLLPIIAEELDSYFGAAFLANQTDAWLADLLVRIYSKLDGGGLLKSGADPEEARATARGVIADFAKRKKILPKSGDPAVRFPLGVLSSDHSGFVSFDLSRARLAGAGSEQTIMSAQAARVLVYPYLVDDLVVDVALQGRVASDAIVGKIALESSAFHNAPALNLPAMQNPNLVDWRLSPGSFAASPLSLVGENGCQSYTPANFATSQVNIRQVVRLDEEIEPGFPGARVIEYSVSFIPIGHSLGQVLYSLPLAPGESTRVAVVNWRRQDSGTRTEDTIVTESLVHDQAHDRVIGETVDAALDEWQRGGSVMGGWANGGGVSANLYSIVGLSGGHMMSAGGGYSTSSGTRTLAADTMQKVTDRIHQASSAVREMHGTVVLQTDQQESESIETRAFANNNRGHSLNILYHEVLQHFRVVTEFKKKYAAVLLKRLPRDFNDDGFVLDMRHRLEPVTLDVSLKPAGYDALRAIDMVRQDQARNPPAPPPFWAGNLRFVRFKFQVRVNFDNTNNVINARVVRYQTPDTPLRYEWTQVNPTGPETYSDPNFNATGTFNNENQDALLGTAAVDIPWWDIKSFNFRMMAVSGDVTVARLDVFGIDENGNSHNLGAAENVTALENSNNALVINAWPPDPPVAPAPPAPAPTPEQSVDSEVYYNAVRLKKHLEAEKEYYGRALDLSDDPNAYASDFETRPFGNGMAIDKVAPTPLEILGTYVAFPLIDQDVIAEEERRWGPEIHAPAERLISLPTRGVFAEAKLGHCNVAEEIDETRFWRWDEHPMPVVASDIAPVQPVAPQPVQLDLKGSELPSPIVSIQNAPALPDPTGMGAALQLLGTANIFRDMSMSTEVGKLMSDLISGSVSMAEAANRARQITAGGGGGSAAGSTGRGGGWDAGGGGNPQGAKPPATTGGGAGSGATQGSASAPGSANAGRRDSPREQHDQLQLYRSAGNEGDITPEQQSSLIWDYLNANKIGSTAAPASAWPKLDPTEVSERILELSANPNMVTQGALGLCGEATFIRNVIRRDRSKFFYFATGLHQSGVAYIGSLRIEPGSDLRNADYIAIGANIPAGGVALPPEADWMILSSIRDSENEWLDFEGSPTENFALSSDFEENFEWHQKSGLYTSVNKDTVKDMAVITAFARKEEKSHILMWMNVAMFEDDRQGGHMISIESPITVDSAANTVSFDYWTWGEPTYRHANVSTERFLANYYGSIAAWFD
jgi:hypothetical protein